MADLWHHYQEGGWAMWLILFWLICSIAVIAERAVYLWGASINKDVFLATMQKCILAGDVAKAVSYPPVMFAKSSALFKANPAAVLSNTHQAGVPRGTRFSAAASPARYCAS